MIDTSDHNQQVSQTPEAATAVLTGPHEAHCFVVMPFGRNRDEKNWFRGWYEVVIEPAVSSCDYEPILSAAEEQPGAINDEIRSHLAFDPMVVVDLGGMAPDAPPNPNVMYELGIRHAFGLPVVIMAWDEQELPFDVNNQRAITTERGFLDLEPTKQKLESFIRAAQDGRFYNPMETVGREAALDATSLVLGEESLLGALTKEVRELRGALTLPRSQFKRRPIRVRKLLGKTNKTVLWGIVKEIDVDTSLWGKYLNLPITPELETEMQGWTISDWTNHFTLTVPELKAVKVRTILKQSLVPDDLLEKVAEFLPEQPWPSGTHKEVAEKFSLTNSQVSRAIKELIHQGRFRDQIDGKLIDPEETAEDASP